MKKTIAIVNFDGFFAEAREWKLNTTLQTRLFLHVATATSVGVDLSDVAEGKERMALYNAARVLSGSCESLESEDEDRYRTNEYLLVEKGEDGRWKLTRAGKLAWKKLRDSVAIY